ncbi:YbjO family protein, partial [Serratia marcescens]
LLATIGSVFPEVFTVEGETSGQILHVLILQKIPDVVILALLFVPAASRRFFTARK